MLKRVIEELAECRGGPNRLKKMRREFEERYQELEDQSDEIAGILELIDEVTGSVNKGGTNGEPDAYQEATQEVSAELPEEEPVDSIGE